MIFKKGHKWYYFEVAHAIKLKASAKGSFLAHVDFNFLSHKVKKRNQRTNLLIIGSIFDIFNGFGSVDLVSL